MGTQYSLLKQLQFPPPPRGEGIASVGRRRWNRLPSVLLSAPCPRGGGGPRARRPRLKGHGHAPGHQQREEESRAGEEERAV